MTVVRVTTPMPVGQEPLVWHFKFDTASQQQALRWARANPQVMRQATLEIVPAF